MFLKTSSAMGTHGAAACEAVSEMPARPTMTNAKTENERIGFNPYVVSGFSRTRSGPPEGGHYGFRQRIYRVAGDVPAAAATQTTRPPTMVIADLMSLI